MKSIISILAATLVTAASTNAAIILSGDFSSGTVVPTLTITEDIVFQIEPGANSVYFLVFAGWGDYDLNADFVAPSPSSQTVQLSVFSNPSITRSLTGLLDYFGEDNNDVTSNDGALILGYVPVQSGDTFTIKAASYTFDSHPDFDPTLVRTFTGQAFLSDDDGNRDSNIVTVPEPTTLLIFSLAALTLLRKKR